MTVWIILRSTRSVNGLQTSSRVWAWGASPKRKENGMFPLSARTLLKALDLRIINTDQEKGAVLLQLQAGV